MPRPAAVVALFAAYIVTYPIAAQDGTGQTNPVETAKVLAELREELTATRARLEFIENLIDELSSRVVEPDATTTNPVARVRLDDEEHEFVSYPVHIGQDVTNTLLKRVGYVTYHDNDHRIPLWVSYRVSQEWLDEPPYIPRKDLRWRTDPEPSATGARDLDYRGSGYSRGHMAMQALLRGRSPECEREGFCFANAIPQRQSFNAGIWLQLEYQVMSWAREFGDVWVVCGPALPSDPVKLNGRVSVPSGFYKIITRDTPTGMEAAAYFSTQDAPGAEPTLDQCPITIDFIESRTGLDFFASLPDWYESEIEARLATMTGLATVAADEGPDVSGAHGKAIVYVTRTGAKYHLGHCQYLRKSRTPLSLEKARPRYEPCPVCRPPA